MDFLILYRSLLKHGFNAAELHGDLPQSSRTSTLNRFKSGDIQLLIASDVAARGLDIADLSHVVNFDVPSNAEDYVHRIGRPGRAGKKGTAFTFVTSEDEKYIEACDKNGCKINDGNKNGLGTGRKMNISEENIVNDNKVQTSK